MFALIGIVVVVGAILGGYLMEHGKIAVLLQPAELIIIGGAALGTVLIANPPHVLKKIVGGMLGLLKPSRFTSKFYLDDLKMYYEVLNKARKEGLMSMESDVEEPEKSEIFKRYPEFLKDHHTRDFVCDTLRLAITGGVDPFDVDQMIESDMEIAHREAAVPIAALSSMADSLPGLGIVAAVLGVVITMGSLGGPPEEIGHKVAAALVGTFLGILMCYGFLGPIAANIKKQIDEEGDYFSCIRKGLLASMKGLSPQLALEAARRAIPHHVRPTFQEMDKACRKGGEAAAPTEAAA